MLSMHLYRLIGIKHHFGHKSSMSEESYAVRRILLFNVWVSVIEMFESYSIHSYIIKMYGEKEKIRVGTTHIQ